MTPNSSCSPSLSIPFGDTAHDFLGQKSGPVPVWWVLSTHLALRGTLGGQTQPHDGCLLVQDSGVCLPGCFISRLCLHTSLSLRGRVRCSRTHCYPKGCGPSSKVNAVWTSLPAGPQLGTCAGLRSSCPSCSCPQLTSAPFAPTKWVALRNAAALGREKETEEGQSRENGGRVGS